MPDNRPTADAHFNAAQTRHVVSTLHHIDDLLGRALQAAEAQRRNSADSLASDTQAAVADLRHELHSALKIWAPTGEPQSANVRWALQTSLRLARVALVELDEPHLSRYGIVAPARAAQVSKTRDRLENALEHVSATLERE